MYFTDVVLSLAAVGLVAGQTCTNITIPVRVNTTNSMISNVTAPLPANQSQVTDFFQRFVQQPQPQANYFINGTYQNTAQYNITATYCVPASGVNASKPLQILIHGIGFDKSYWNFTYETSYVRRAVAAGYATLALDRLGEGNSSYPDGRNQVQTYTHRDVVYAINQAAKNGSLPGGAAPFRRTVLVGHSYGSIISNALVARWPNAVDGIVLTGYSANATWLPMFITGTNNKIAAQHVPTRFNVTARRLPYSYLVWSDIYNNLLNFHHYPDYNQSVLALTEARKGPVTYGEVITLGQGTVPTNFTGPVAVATGDRDFIFCGGDCTTGANSTGYASIPAAVGALFNQSRNFTTLIQPNAGHALQLANSNANSTAQILSFLASNGL